MIKLSYAALDLDLAVRIEGALEKAGITVFRDQDVPKFEPITARLAEALDAAKVLLAVYSARYPDKWQPTTTKGDCEAGSLALGEATLLGAAGEVPTSGLRPTSTTTTTTR